MAERVTRTLCLLLCAAAVYVWWDSDRRLDERIGEPFAGFFVYANGVVAPPAIVPGTEAAGRVRALDHVVAIDGEPTEDASSIREALLRIGPDRPVVFTLRGYAGARQDVTLDTRRLEPGDLWIIRRLAPACAALVMLMGLIAVLLDPLGFRARLFFLFTWATGMNFGLLSMETLVLHRFAPWNFVLGGLTVAAGLALGASFPTRRWPFGRWSGQVALVAYTLLGALLAGFLVTYWVSPGLSFAFARLALLGNATAVALFAANTGYTAFFAESWIQRQQGRMILAAPLLSLIVVGVLAIMRAWPIEEFLIVLVLANIVLLPLFALLSQYRQNLFGLDEVARRALTVGSIAGLAAIGWAAAFAFATAFVGFDAAWAAGAISIVAFAVLVPLVAPIRARVEALVETFVFPGRRQATGEVDRLARALTRVQGEREVATLLRESVARAMRCERVHVLMADEARFVEESAGADPPLVLPASDPVASALRRGDRANLDSADPRAARLGRRLEELDVRVLLPLAAGDATQGGLLLGPRQDGRPYVSADEQLLASLTAQAAIAIENARAWDRLEDLRRRTSRENVYLRQEIELRDGFEEIVGSTPALREALAQVEQVAPTDASVLIEGETGTGKELIVRALHRLSGRSERPLLEVACAALPEALVESEFFGHEPGAFTGASQRQIGRFERADGGSLFLDDVDTLPLGVQAKLLRVLQEGEVQRLGSTDTRQVDVRVVAATNRDLMQEAAAGRFREDLYYRLSVVPIRLPPLRERGADLPLLIQHFIEQESAKLGRAPRPLSRRAFDQLQAHDWPGNVRELRNVIERAVVMSQGPAIELAGSLGASNEGADADAQSPAVRLDGRPLSEMLDRFRASLIRAALTRTDGNQSAAAALLGVQRQSLSRTMRTLGIRP